MTPSEYFRWHRERLCVMTISDDNPPSFWRDKAGEMGAIAENMANEDAMLRNHRSMSWSPAAPVR